MKRSKRGESGRRRTTTGAELGLGALLLGYGAAVHHQVSPRWELASGLAAGAGAVAIARVAGASWSDLGLDPAHGADGLRAGSAVLPVVSAAVLAGVALPPTRAFFADDRVADASGREVAYDVLVRIPIATATAEELIFRSALLGLALQRHTRRQAVVSTAVLFGLWHVIPALRSHHANRAAAKVADRVGGAPATVLATLAVTAAAGTGFAWLRLRSRSVVAPIVAHAGINAAALLAARFATRRR